MHLWIIDQECPESAYEHLWAHGADVYIGLSDRVPVSWKELEILYTLYHTRLNSIYNIGLFWTEWAHNARLPRLEHVYIQLLAKRPALEQ